MFNHHCLEANCGRKYRLLDTATLAGVGARRELPLLKAGSLAALGIERRDYQAQDRMTKLVAPSLLSGRRSRTVTLTTRSV